MKPILFNTKMVRAILDGRKTVTRRPIKPQPIMYDFGKHKSLAFVPPAIIKGYLAIGVDRVIENPTYLKIPYQKGDILYVRETWCDVEKDFVETFEELKFMEPIKYLYKVDDLGKEHKLVNASVRRWRPSIHMPKQAARIFLRVTNVRVAKLRAMNVNDFLREGVCLLPKTFNSAIDSVNAHSKEFKAIWNSTIKKYDYGSFWESNPWTWVTEFEVIKEA